ncbi:hypothetical protein KI387_017212, partial [Taxus chinensis]
QGKSRVSNSWNRHNDDNSPNVAVSYNDISCKGIGRDSVDLNGCAEKNAEFAQTVQKPVKSLQQRPKKVLYSEDSVRPAKPSPISLMKTSISDMKSIYVTQPRHRRQAESEGIEFMSRNESPSSYHYQYTESPGRRKVGELPVHRYSDGGGSLRPTIVDSQRRGLHAKRENGDSHPGTIEPHHRRQDQSPLPHHYQGRLGNKLEGTSPSCERRILVEGGTSAPLTPGRSRMRSTNTRPNETPERSSPLPKFGDWNEKDPTSADDFTHIFNKRRQEKLTGVSTVPAMPTGTPSHINNHKQANVSLYKSLVEHFNQAESFAVFSYTRFLLIFIRISCAWYEYVS